LHFFLDLPFNPRCGLCTLQFPTGSVEPSLRRMVS
jgi:hypothetical protein